MHFAILTVQIIQGFLPHPPINITVRKGGGVNAFFSCLRGKKEFGMGEVTGIYAGTL